jgi:hypothetical protein
MKVFKKSFKVFSLTPLFIVLRSLAVITIKPHIHIPLHQNILVLASFTSDIWMPYSAGTANFISKLINRLTFLDIEGIVMEGK